LNHNCSIKECLTVGDIPCGGKKENYYFYCIRQNNTLIGFLDYYLEYKQKNTAYICSIYIKEKYRKEGFGKEVIDAIVKKFTLIGINKIHLHVSLRNAIGLNFWVKQGFNHIRNVEYNGNLLPENFGGIELIKKI
jgi:ribosomal protein S18 acetylase RimI-like enzyme